MTALLFLILFLFFFDIDKRMPTVTHALVERKKAEIARQQKEAEENRVRELKEYCEKKGLDFDTENRKYLDKKAKKDAKKAAKKAKQKE